MDAKIAKLDEQFAEDALKNPYKESNLFAGISIFVNGLTNPSADELKRIMMKNGGVYHAYQRRSTTFIIAANLPDVKIRQITSAKIISAQWIVDCLKESRILDYSKYLLYTNCKISQPKILFVKSDAKNEVVANTLHDNQTKAEAKDKKPKEFVENLNVLNTLIRDNETPIKTKKSIPKISNQLGTSPKNDAKKSSARTAVDPNFLSEFYNNSRLHHIATLGASFKHHISKLRETHDQSFPARDTFKQTLQNQHSTNNCQTVQKSIMHIDMDCFFVSVGLRSRPHLKGFPIAVTHSKGSNANNLKSLNGADRQKEMELYVKRHEDRYSLVQSKFGDEIHDNRSENLKLLDNTTSLSEIASCSYEARKMGVKNGMFVGAALKLCPDLKTIPYDFDSYKTVAHILYDTITR